MSVIIGIPLIEKPQYQVSLKIALFVSGIKDCILQLSGERKFPLRNFTIRNKACPQTKFYIYLWRYPRDL